MKKINKLKDIESISTFYKGMLVGYGKQKNVLFISEENGNIIYKIPSLRDMVELIDRKLFLFNQDLYIFDDELKNFILYRRSKGGGGVNLFNSNYIENNYNRSSRVVQITLYDGTSDVKLWERNYKNRRSWLGQGPHLFVIDLLNEHIDFIDENTGIVQKTLNFENPKMCRFVYYYDNILIVSLKIKPLEEYHLLGLDASTGEEKWRIEHANFMYIQDPETGYLYDIGGKRFNVINPLEGKVIYQCDMTSENEKFGVIPEWGILGKDGIYFMDNFPRSKVGFINFNTHKIDFVLDVEFDAGIKIMKMLYHNGRLYILDTNETLHIFAE